MRVELANRRQRWASTKAEQQIARPFDEGVAIWERHWRPYSAATDPHTVRWRHRILAPQGPAESGGGSATNAHEKVGRCRRAPGNQARATVIKQRQVVGLSHHPRSTLYPLNQASAAQRLPAHAPTHAKASAADMERKGMRSLRSQRAAAPGGGLPIELQRRLHAASLRCMVQKTK